MRLLRNNQILRIAVLAGSLALLPAGPLFAGPIAYLVTVNTGAISGTSGFLDFSFAPGYDSQSAFVTIGSFAPGGSLSGSPVVNGGVLGVLPGTVTIDNSTAFNDYFQGFEFGTTIQFLLSFGGPAVTSPDGTSSGSTFGFGMFENSAGTIPLLTTDPFGNAFTVDVNPDGSTTPIIFPAALDAPPAATLESTTPEPAPCALLALGLVVLFAVSKKEIQLYSVFKYAIRLFFSPSVSMSL